MKEPLPKILSVDITNKCDNRCIYCRDIHNNKSRDLSESLMTEAIFKSIKEIGSIEWLKLSGGEPLLFTSVDKIIALAASMGIKTILQTNGNLLTLEKATELKDCGLTKVQLSVDGPEVVHDELRGKGSFSRVKKAALACADVGLVFQMKCTLSEINKNFVEDLFVLARQCGPERLNFRFLLPIGRARKLALKEVSKDERKELVEKIYEFSKKYSIDVISGDPCSFLLMSLLEGSNIGDYQGACTIGINSIHISADGHYKPCSMIDFNLGDVLEEDFVEIWKNNDFLRRNREREFLKCDNCLNKKICGGCRVIAYNSSGDYFGEDTFCFMA